MAVTDRGLSLVTLLCVGLIGLVSVLGVVALQMMGHETPPSLVAIAGTALGSLASLLSRPTSRDTTTTYSNGLSPRDPVK